MFTRMTVFFSFLVAWALTGCTSISDFSTGPEECYEGPIVRADYVRSSSFDEQTTLRLTLDVSALNECKFEGLDIDAGLNECSTGAMLTTTHDDAHTFIEAPVRTMRQIPNDSISLLQFPGGRLSNYIAYASPSDGPPAMIVLSLMENEEVEVRIIRPPDGSSDYRELFGVFRLVRKEGCVFDDTDTQ